MSLNEQITINSYSEGPGVAKRRLGGAVGRETSTRAAARARGRLAVSPRGRSRSVLEIRGLGGCGDEERVVPRAREPNLQLG